MATKKKKQTTKKLKKAVKKTTSKKAVKKVVKKAAKKPAVKSKANKKLAKKATKKVSPKKIVASKKLSGPKKSPTNKAAPSSEAKAPTSIPSKGSSIPTLALENSDGYAVNLKDLASKNRHLVLYFYPKDDTPGCTQEACDFRDNIANLTEHGATVVGVSPDSKESHQNFANKYNLNFTLLADPNHELAEKMGIWKLKQFMGNSYMGVERSTFLFTDGKLTQHWSPVKVDGHVTDVMSVIGVA